MLEDYLRSVQQRENSPGKDKNNGLRELRIGATKTIGDYVITDRIHDFLNQPDTALTLIVDNTKHLLHLLEQNTLDYAIIEGFLTKQIRKPVISTGTFCGDLPEGSSLCRP